MFEYEEAIEQFAGVLEEFIAKYELPDSWFVAPDHLAIKCADGLDYVFVLEELLPDAAQTTEITMDKRRLATVQLISPVTVGGLGSVSWIEVMEPRPEKVGKDVVGLEHMEFCYSKFDEITELLTERNIAFSMQSNLGHSWVNIVINEQGQELKLNDKLLADTVALELEEGKARII